MNGPQGDTSDRFYPSSFSGKEHQGDRQQEKIVQGTDGKIHLPRRRELAPLLFQRECLRQWEQYRRADEKWLGSLSCPKSHRSALPPDGSQKKQKPLLHLEGPRHLMGQEEEGRVKLPGSCRVSGPTADQRTTKAESSSLENSGVLYCQRLPKCNSQPCPYKEHALLKLLKIKTGVIY